MIAVQSLGTSVLGEVWYAEGDTPLGPWVYARKIVTHERYSFYNPKQHPQFDKEKGRSIFFEGTYTHTFSGNPDPTPRYDYNQIMYKLDLSDPRLVLPVPVYQLSAQVPDRFGTRPRRGGGDPSRRIAFFAPDRPGKGTVPVHEWQNAAGGRGLRLGAPPKASHGKSAPVFFALPAQTRNPPGTTVPLYEFIHRDGKRRAYGTDPSWSMAGYQRGKEPFCRVWRNLMKAALPAE
jgi:hypothetical protein